MIYGNKNERKIIRTQIDPIPPDTRTEAFVAEFYDGEGKALGSVRCVIPRSKHAERLGIAFKRARPACLMATSVRFFED